jgi:hypothetical protein
MRAQAIVGVSMPALLTCLSFAQGPSAPPTRVCQPGIYGCPAHTDILATWPTLCPLCQAVLEAGPPSASTVGDVTPVAGRDDQRGNGVTEQMQRDQQWRERARRNEQWRQWGQRNDQLRQRARRNKELRGQARRNEEFRQPYPDAGLLPPEGFAYPYPYNYFYNPNTGQYEYLRPDQAYPYGGYQYNPNAGLRYYNPNADQYHYNPNAGHYYYDPYTGQYQYVNPRDAFTPINLGPGIDMDNRRRDEDERAREAQRKENLREQARRDAELWGQYHSYGYQPPRTYSYRYLPPGPYQSPYRYDPELDPGDTPWYGGYYYNPKTGQYQYIKPGYASPKARTKERPEREGRQRR